MALIVEGWPTALGDATTFTATVSTGSNVTYTWTFGDAHPADGPIVQHTYTSAGVYTATVTAENPVSVEMATTAVIIEESDHAIYLPFVKRP